MLIMKSKKRLIKFKTLLITTCLIFLSAGALCFNLNKTAYALTATAERVLPISTMESYALNKPDGVYADDDVLAIIQENCTSLLIYQNNSYKLLSSADKDFRSLKQVKRFSDDELIVSDNGPIYSVNLNTYAVNSLYFDKEISGTSFDFNGRYLVTAYSGNAFFYEVSNGKVISMPFPSLTDVTDTTIAVNDTSVFYVSNHKLYSRDFADFETVKEIYSVSPSKIIASNEYLFYVLDGNIYKLSLDGSINVKLSFPKSDYDLGSVNSTTDISLYNGNLLVTNMLSSTDGSGQMVNSNSIQEFKLDGNNLVFTGFAIAKGKTAYNRIVNAKSVEKFGNTTAVLEDYKISLIDTKNVNLSQETFKNFCLGSAPDYFAFAGKTILGANVDGSGFVIDVDSGKQTSISFEKNIVDLCFKCGYYYALAVENSKSIVFKLNDTTGEIVETKEYDYAFQLMEVDVFGNYYLATDKHIYKDDGVNVNYFSDSYSAKKMMTDLSGKLFLGNGTGIFTFSSPSVPDVIKLDVGKIKDFCINIDNATAYFIIDGEEYLYKSTELGNVAISSIVLPQDFSLSRENATESDVKIHSIKERHNLFNVVLTDSGVEYVELGNNNNEYLFIREIQVTNTYSITILANHDGLFVAGSTSLNNVDLTFNTAPSVAYTTTTVHAYYLPLITMDMEYSLLSGADRYLLPKHAKIKPISSLTVFGMDFYFAEIGQDQNTNTAFIPINFTVEVLAEDREFDKFTIETIKSTVVYADKEMTTALTSLPKTQIRLYERENSVCKIRYLNDGVWVEGYVASSQIMNTAKDAVRNILVLLAVVTSLCGTTSFFILRKR